ncbi:MAG: hypothetical protein KAS74_04925 [Methanosarcinales archaeon]|nr:hypothetical protein [Methanosarcinales archaeon]
MDVLHLQVLVHARATREQKCDINQEREWETVSANMKGTLPDLRLFRRWYDCRDAAFARLKNRGYNGMEYGL